MYFSFVFRRHRSRVPGRLHENPDRFQRLVRWSAVLVRVFVRSGLRVHQRDRPGLLRVLHTTEQVRNIGKEFQTRGCQEESSGEYYRFHIRTAGIESRSVCLFFFFFLIPKRRLLRHSTGSREANLTCDFTRKTTKSKRVWCELRVQCSESSFRRMCKDYREKAV